jgi:hypothetical protein
VFLWKHTDARGLVAALSGATERARSVGWTGESEGATPAGDLRSLAVLALVNARLLGTGEAAVSLVRPTEAGLELRLSADIPAAIDPMRRRHQAAVIGPFIVLSDGRSAAPSFGLATSAGSDAVTNDAGLAPLALVALVTGGVVASTIGAYACVVVAEKALEVIDRKLERDARHAAMMAAAAEHNAALVEHAKREALAGGPLPFSEAENRALSVVEARIADAGKPLSPLDTVKPPTGRDVTGAASSLGVGLLALAGLVGFLALKGKI